MATATARMPRWTGSETISGLDLVQRVVALDEGTDGFLRSWIMLFPVGRYQHPGYGTLNFTRARLEHIKTLFDERVRGIDVALDVDHAADHGGDSRATGWIETLELREANPADETPAGLWGHIRWTPYGAKLLKDQEYRYFSPSFGAWKDPATGQSYKDVLLGGALTNRPFLKNMPAVTLAEPAISRKSWASVNKSTLPRPCFLVQGDAGDKSTWKLPVYEGAGPLDADGHYTQRGALNINAVRSALAALGGARTGTAMAGVPAGVRARLQRWLAKYGAEGETGERATTASDPEEATQALLVLGERLARRAPRIREADVVDSGMLLGAQGGHPPGYTQNRGPGGKFAPGEGGEGGHGEGGGEAGGGEGRVPGGRSSGAEAKGEGKRGDPVARSSAAKSLLEAHREVVSAHAEQQQKFEKWVAARHAREDLEERQGHLFGKPRASEVEAAHTQEARALEAYRMAGMRTHEAQGRLARAVEYAQSWYGRNGLANIYHAVQSNPEITPRDYMQKAMARGRGGGGRGGGKAGGGGRAAAGGARGARGGGAKAKADGAEGQPATEPRARRKATQGDGVATTSEHGGRGEEATQALLVLGERLARGDGERLARMTRRDAGRILLTGGHPPGYSQNRGPGGKWGVGDGGEHAGGSGSGEGGGGGGGAGEGGQPRGGGAGARGGAGAGGGKGDEQQGGVAAKPGGIKGALARAFGRGGKTEESPEQAARRQKEEQIKGRKEAAAMHARAVAKRAGKSDEEAEHAASKAAEHEEAKARGEARDEEMRGLHARAEESQKAGGLKAEVQGSGNAYQRLTAVREVDPHEFDPYTAGSNPYVLAKLYGEHQLGAAVARYQNDSHALNEMAKFVGVEGLHPSEEGSLAARQAVVSRITAKVTEGRYSANFAAHQQAAKEAEQAAKGRARAQKEAERPAKEAARAQKQAEAEAARQRGEERAAAKAAKEAAMTKEDWAKETARQQARIDQINKQGRAIAERIGAFQQAASAARAGWASDAYEGLWAERGANMKALERAVKAWARAKSKVDELSAREQNGGGGGGGGSSNLAEEATWRLLMLGERLARQHEPEPRRRQAVAV